jgi:hypothetical protein
VGWGGVINCDREGGGGKKIKREGGELAGRYSHHHIFHRYKVQQDSFLLIVRKGKKIGLGRGELPQANHGSDFLQIGDSSTSPPEPIQEV